MVQQNGTGMNKRKKQTKNNDNNNKIKQVNQWQTIALGGTEILF